MNPKIDLYLSQGCMRCEFGGTTRCKVHRWTNELNLLRYIVVECGLKEELKWSVPCYTYNKKNILIISAFREYCAISFFKGALLNDQENILEKPGENSNEGRLIKFTTTDRINELEPVLRSYIQEAIEIEISGLKIERRPVKDFIIPDELQQRFLTYPLFKDAFDNLTPGRKKGYLIYFSQAKQPKTREIRIEKCIPGILEGKGLNER
ncbi:YdeI family protein [Saccharicrinis sp. FJH54]|uniref:YdeI/OmpD-associated family protein n=1 Tax=Saccharicrinis sp. FJH54 TaxID=3344665 RepID=UPI0035D4B9B7